MNHKGGLALVRGTWLSWLQHRGFFFILAFLWMVPPLIAMFVWMAAAGDGSIGGLDRGGFVAYYLALIVANQLTYAQANWTVGDEIRYGGLNAWLLRPIPALYSFLSSEVAGKVVYMIFLLPVTAALAALLRPELHVRPADALLSLLSLLMAWALRTFWGMAVAELAFWSTRADALLVVQDSLVFVFSGLVAPVALLPAGLGRWALLLPFRYMVGFPVEIFTGQLTAAETGLGLVLQAGWAALALALAWGLWRGGVGRYTAVGG